MKTTDKSSWRWLLAGMWLLAWSHGCIIDCGQRIAPEFPLESASEQSTERVESPVNTEFPEETTPQEQRPETTPENDGCFLPAGHPIRQMQPNSWQTLPNTRMSSVAPTGPNDFPGTWGSIGPKALFTRSGGIYDDKRHRLILWGGGHTDYKGNEVYAFSVASMQWKRLTSPTLNPVKCQDDQSGAPASRQTQNHLIFLPGLDGMFVDGGKTDCSNCGSEAWWLFDLAGNAWRKLGTRAVAFGECADSAAYDDGTGRIFWLVSGGALHSYDVKNNQWKAHPQPSPGRFFGGMATVVEPQRRQLLSFGKHGHQPPLSVLVHDLAQPDNSRQLLATTGDNEILQQGQLGAVYVPAQKIVAVWGGGDVYIYQPSSRVWKKFRATGAPSLGTFGILGRWQALPGCDAIIAATAIDADVSVYKLPPRSQLP